MDADSLLPPALLKGPHFRVDKNVDTHGFANTYTIRSDFGSFAAHGNDMLRIREHEIAALAQLADMKKTKEFAEAAQKAVTSPLKGVGNMILHPVDTVTGVPKGAWRYMSRWGEMLRSDRSEYEDSKAKELIGFGSAKRRVAHQLGVEEIQVVHGVLPVAYAANKTLVVPLVLDYGVWSQAGVDLLDGIAKASKRREVEKTELWVTGQLSLRAKEEIEQAGWEVHERAFSYLYGKK